MGLRKKTRMWFFILGAVLGFWILATLWAQWSGKSEVIQSGMEKLNVARICIYYNSDPIYNLDEQVCKQMLDALANESYVELRTTQSGVSLDEFDAFIFCANTYNFAPDWGVTNAMGKLKDKTRGRTVGLLTLGAGSTGRAERLMKKASIPLNAQLVLESKIWLMKPNKEDVISREDNLNAAKEMAVQFAQEVLANVDSNN